jgi:tetratricopeptide (TPR) repeat protein
MMSGEQQTEAVDDETAESGVEHTHDALPPIFIPEEWPKKPGVRLLFDLADPPPTPANPIESTYAAGLTSLRNQGQTVVALEQFRAVVGQDTGGSYNSARLLALLISAEVGDVASVRALLPSCLTHAQPDAFAQCVLAKTALELYLRSDSEVAAITVHGCLDQPALTAQVALTGCMIAMGLAADAVGALEDAIPLWEDRHTAWREESEKIIAEILRERRKEDWYYRTHREEVDTEVLRRGARAGSTAPRGPAGPLLGFDMTMCRLYGDVGDYDAIIAYVDRYPRWEASALMRAAALSDKGMADAALVVLDDYLRKPENQYWANEARYKKAGLLIGQGDRRRARKELARLYADDPFYEDEHGLRAKLDVASQPVGRQRIGRAAIPEKVRHAVWRRDEGRCVQCGSQENLEFDHIIPVVRGGANTERNLQLLCEPCNRAKSAKI